MLIGLMPQKKAGNHGVPCGKLPTSLNYVLKYLFCCNTLLLSTLAFLLHLESNTINKLYFIYKIFLFNSSLNFLNKIWL